MAKTKTSAAVKNRYAAKAYDRLSVIVPKGQKETVEAIAAKHGESISGIFCKALLAYEGLQEWPAVAEDSDTEQVEDITEE